MCGIAGIYFTGKKDHPKQDEKKLLNLLQHRGPDFNASFKGRDCKLFHTRLEIIDTSPASHQPFLSEDKKQALVFNGEIFNYHDLQKTLPGLKTNGDVEVFFKLLQKEGEKCLDKLNGFFAFAFYDENTGSLLLARDRCGVKPLYYYKDEDKFAFASELKPLLELCGKQELNHEQVYTYFRLNYCAGPETIFKNVLRLLPGHSIHINKNDFQIKPWYKVPVAPASNDLATLLEDSVKLRLNADVPLGTFLSGGVDSSIISALAIRHKPGLKTFSIGFEKEKFFDESHYSQMVAKHIGSEHHALLLKEEDLTANIDDFLNSIDEPFADASAFNFYMLSKYTRQHVKVALSGDGADELFKGYYKHRALELSHSELVKSGTKLLAPFFRAGKSSREGFLKNKVRQLKKFAELSDLPESEKQEFLASISDHDSCRSLLKNTDSPWYFKSLFRIYPTYSNFRLEDSFDLQTVLADDMLVKADRFSMRHGIEIRNPFLDYRIVEYALNLPKTKKIKGSEQKIILKETFKGLLPSEIFHRSKKGFELPLQKWLLSSLRKRVEEDWLNLERIEAEGLLEPATVKQLRDQLFSSSPGDSAAKLWAIIVFKSWFRNFEEYIRR